ncbi:hypothetical protein CVT24_010188 [Panaeolus cyanescens]|uniref:Uncharacterized protein n=1 Tax=Panaeolus cyanescens TaxID=181874 RepID=A0A409YPW2_9AGAR|nr:hypothetical protein CVT24_010188 [Panaeolus cyanescens]
MDSSLLPTDAQTDPPTLVGPPKRKKLLPRRNRKCLFLGLPFLTIVSIRVALFSWSVYQRFQDPHVHASHDEKSAIPVQESMIVRPLIGKKGELGGVFDVIATVWIKEKFVKDTPSERPWESVLNDWQKRSTTPIFSKTVFEGVTLQDKLLQTAVELQIPVHHFNRGSAKEDDLRASFVLVPKSPSFLDYMPGVASKPNMNNLKLPPVRSYPVGHVMKS